MPERETCSRRPLVLIAGWAVNRLRGSFLSEVLEKKKETKMDSKTKEGLLKISLAMREARRAERREAWKKPQLSAAERFSNRILEGISCYLPEEQGERENHG